MKGGLDDTAKREEKAKEHVKRSHLTLESAAPWKRTRMGSFRTNEKFYRSNDCHFELQDIGHERLIRKL